MHVDEFIDRYTPIHDFSSDEEREAERYARFALMMMRLPAALQIDFAKFTPKLFCNWKGERCRVVFASRMGWIGLTRNFKKDTYDKQVDVGECSGWGEEP
jgi:hypothetical protein